MSLRKSTSGFRAKTSILTKRLRNLSVDRSLSKKPRSISKRLKTNLLGSERSSAKKHSEKYYFNQTPDKKSERESWDAHGTAQGVAGTYGKQEPADAYKNRCKRIFECVESSGKQVAKAFSGNRE